MKKIDRDYNASLNILEEGLRILNKNCRDDSVSSVNIQTLVYSSWESFTFIVKEVQWYIFLS